MPDLSSEAEEVAEQTPGAARLDPDGVKNREEAKRRKWLTFDILFGLVLPVLCFIFDPIVFKTSFRAVLGPTRLQAHRLTAYGLYAIAATVLALWLASGSQVKRSAPIVSGALFAAGLGALAVGVLIFPLSLFGSLLLIGVLGFTPLFTSFVFMRHSVSAFRQSWATQNRALVLVLVAFTALVAGGGPYYANQRAQREFREVIAESISVFQSGSDVEKAAASARLRRWTMLGGDSDELVSLHESEPEPDRSAAIAALYLAIAGESIEQRKMILMD